MSGIQRKRNPQLCPEANISSKSFFISIAQNDNRYHMIESDYTVNCYFAQCLNRTQEDISWPSVADATLYKSGKNVFFNLF